MTEAWHGLQNNASDAVVQLISIDRKTVAMVEEGWKAGEAGLGEEHKTHRKVD